MVRKRLIQTPHNPTTETRMPGTTSSSLRRAVIFLGGFERFLEADHVFAGAQTIERFGFALELLGMIRGELPLVWFALVCVLLKEHVQTKVAKLGESLMQSERVFSGTLFVVGYIWL